MRNKDVLLLQPGRESVVSRENYFSRVHATKNDTLLNECAANRSKKKGGLMVNNAASWVTLGRDCRFTYAGSTCIKKRAYASAAGTQR